MASGFAELICGNLKVQAVCLNRSYCTALYTKAEYCDNHVVHATIPYYVDG